MTTDEAKSVVEYMAQLWPDWKSSGRMTPAIVDLWVEELAKTTVDRAKKALVAAFQASTRLDPIMAVYRALLQGQPREPGPDHEPQAGGVIRGWSGLAIACVEAPERSPGLKGRCISVVFARADGSMPSVTQAWEIARAWANSHAALYGGRWEVYEQVRSMYDCETIRQNIQRGAA